MSRENSNIETDEDFLRGHDREREEISAASIRAKNQLQNTLGMSNETHARLVAEVVKLRSEKAELQAKYEKSKAENETLKAEVEELKTEVEELKAEVADLKTVNEKLEIENATFVSALEKSSVMLKLLAETLEAAEDRKDKVVSGNNKALAENRSMMETWEATLKNPKAVNKEPETTDTMLLAEEQVAEIETTAEEVVVSLAQAGIFRRASKTEKEPEAMAFNHAAQ